MSSRCSFFLYTLCFGVLFFFAIPVGGQSSKDASSQAQAHALELQAKRDAALQSGDAASIFDATRAYLTDLLLGLANLESQQENTEAASRCYTEALALQDSPLLHLKFGSFLLATGKAPEALDQLRMLTEGELAQDADAWTTQALAYRGVGDYAHAATSLEHALQLRPDPDVAYALGSVLLMQHEKAKAAVLFQRIFLLNKRPAYWHVAVGDAYRQARYYNEAIEEFRRAIAIDPKTANAEFFLGLTYLQMNEWGPNSDSLQHLRRAVASSPHQYLSNFYLGALESTEGRDLASSDEHLETARAADPNQPEVWVYLGLNANREHKESVAERDFRRAIELTGRNDSTNNFQIRKAYFALGRILIASGRKEEGTALLEKYRTLQAASVAASSATINQVINPESGMGPSAADPLTLPTGPGFPGPASSGKGTVSVDRAKELARETAELKRLVGEAYNDLGTAQARQQLYPGALASFQRAEQWEQGNGQILRNLGTAAFRVGDFAESSRALHLYWQIEGKSEVSSPSIQRAGLMLGFSDFNLGRFDEAAKAFEQVQAATMADPRAAYSWAFSLARIGKAQDANRIADSLSEQPLPPEQLALVCHLYVDNENYEGSLACFRKAYASNSKLQLAHYEAGQALVHLDRPAEAIVELQQEEKLSPGNPNVKSALAYALLQASRKVEAQTLLAQVTTEHPEQAEAQYQFGKLLLEEGETAKAVAHLEASEKADASRDYVHYQLGVAYKKAGRQSDAERELKLYREIKDKKREASSAALQGAH